MKAGINLGPLAHLNIYEVNSFNLFKHYIFNNIQTVDAFFFISVEDNA